MEKGTALPKVLFGIGIIVGWDGFDVTEGGPADGWRFPPLARDVSSNGGRDEAAAAASQDCILASIPERMKKKLVLCNLKAVAVETLWPETTGHRLFERARPSWK